MWDVFVFFLLTHLVFVFSLDEEGKSESHLRQLRDADPILGAVKLWGVVILVNEQDGKCGHHRGFRRSAVVFQLSGLREKARRERWRGVW